MAAVVFPRVRRPQVSVLMVTYGGWDFVSKALESLRENTDPRYEIIVVDNASPDGTADRLRDEVVNARLVFNTANRGFGPATNQAASFATAPYLALLNSDCFVRPGWLPPLLKALEEDEALGAAAPLILNADGSLQESGCLLFGNAYTQFFGFGDDPGKPEYRFRRTVDYASGACLVLRRRIFLDLSGFDVSYVPAYFEDVDLCLRLRQRGFGTLVEPRSVVTHLRGASGGGSFAVELWSRNLPIFRERWKDLLARRPAYFEPAATPRSSLSARDAVASGRLLLVSERPFSPDDTGGGAAAVRLLKALAAGWPDCRITALTPAAPPDQTVTDAFLNSGIEVVADVPDVADWLKQRRLHYDVVLFGSGRGASLFDAALRDFQPQAARIEGAADLDREALVAALGRAGVAPSRHIEHAVGDGRVSKTSQVPKLEAGDSPHPVALVVLGMHRSGTSALAGCLHALGVPFGEPLLPPNFANEKGYFEHAEVVAIHDELLRSLGTSALDPRPLPSGWAEGPSARAARERLREVLQRNFGGALFWAVKDPRLCILLPLWLPLFGQMEVEPHFLLMFRSPWEIVRSLGAGHGLATSESLDLWFRHSTSAEAATRGSVRAFLTYDRLLSEPEAALASLGDALSVVWPSPPARAEIHSFLEPSLRHWKEAATPDDVPPALGLAVTELHECLLELGVADDSAAHRRIDLRRVACDEAFGALRRGQPDPGGSEEEYDIRWLSLEAPSVMKPGEQTSGRVSFSHAGRMPLSSRALGLSYHWLDADDPFRVVVWEAPRTPVRRVLAPGETWSGEFPVRAPERPGHYLLQVDLVREGVAWFSTKGVTPLTRQVKIA